MSDKNQTRRKIKENKKTTNGRRIIEANFGKIQKEINLEQVIYWIGLQATAEEIAGSFRVSVDTLDLRLQEYFGKGFTDIKKVLGDGADGKLVLRRNQFRQSEHNASMAIWLGKQWLGQKDIMVNETFIKENQVKIYLPDNGMQCEQEAEESIKDDDRGI